MPNVCEHMRIAADREGQVERNVGSEANRSPQAKSWREMKRALPLVALLASVAGVDAAGYERRGE